MFNVYQHWDPLKVCAVGKSYPPEFYSFIENSKVRSVMERIAQETEEDYQSLIKLLESFGVETIRPYISPEQHRYLVPDGSTYIIPPMTPRDYSMMLGETFYFRAQLPPYHPGTKRNIEMTWGPLLDRVRSEGNPVHIEVPNQYLTSRYTNSAMTTRVGKDVYAGSTSFTENMDEAVAALQSYHPEYRWRAVSTNGHNDGTYCPVVPGLIISLNDIPTYAETFPDWEVVYLPNQSWDKVNDFLALKNKNKGKWWVPGEEFNDEFIDFVESWLTHWVGYVEETVFDVNMLVIDEKNVICNNYNKDVFNALERHGVTPHILNFRHRYFWDGGLHCITSDIHREGTMKDYFPNRSS